MKKIISINLSGRIIPIEDTAYESLQRYIESLRRYFASEEGREEIINDIESRIAELLNDKIRKGAAAATDEDVEEIIASMGRVEDFEQEDQTPPSADPNQNDDKKTSDRKEPQGRLYRDTSDRFLGGVCSGIASYMNFDPAIVRLLFAVICFGGFGLGFLIYIVLWIVLPQRKLGGYSGKRLFRNPDNQMIGGVCSGLAAYFHSSSRTIRLIFAAPIIVNIFFAVLNGLFFFLHFEYTSVGIAFGSITSTFIMAYIILWIVLPAARTPYEKMEMRGEKIDVSRIRQNVQESLNDLKTHAHTWSEEVKETADKFTRKAKEFAAERKESWDNEAQPARRGIVHAIGVLLQSFSYFVAGLVAFALSLVLLALVFGSGTLLWPVQESVLQFFLNGLWQNLFFWLTIVFFLILPFIGFLILLLRKLAGIRAKNNSFGWALGIIWIIGWLSLAAFVTSVAIDFRSRREVSAIVPLPNPVMDKLVIQSSEPELEFGGDLFFDHEEIYGWDLTEDSLKLGDVRLKIFTSADSNYKVRIVRKSNGSNARQAANRAGKIHYHAAATGNVLDLGSGYAISRNDRYRGQMLAVHIEVPLGRKIRFDESVSEKFHPVYTGNGETHRKGRRSREERHEPFNYTTGADYIMTKKGLIPAGEDD